MSGGVFAGSAPVSAGRPPALPCVPGTRSSHYLGSGSVFVGEIFDGAGLVAGGNSVNVDEDGAESADAPVVSVATPIFDALLTELELEWPAAYDPDAPNAWFEPVTKPDPATVADPLR